VIPFGEFFYNKKPPVRAQLATYTVKEGALCKEAELLQGTYEETTVADVVYVVNGLLTPVFFQLLWRIHQGDVVPMLQEIFDLIQC